MNPNRMVEIRMWRSGLMRSASGSPPRAEKPKTVLMVIDVDYSNGWKPEQIKEDPGLRQAADSIVRKISQARESNLPVIFIMLEHGEPLSQLEANSSCLACDRRNNRLPDFLDHKHGEEFEPVFVKRFSDAFTHPKLASYLEKMGAKKLILAGCFTFLCVEATAGGAVRAGFDIELAGDAVYPPFADGNSRKNWMESVRSSVPSGSKQNVTIG